MAFPGNNAIRFALAERPIPRSPLADQWGRITRFYTLARNLYVRFATSARKLPPLSLPGRCIRQGSGRPAFSARTPVSFDSPLFAGCFACRAFRRRDEHAFTGELEHRRTLPARDARLRCLRERVWNHGPPGNGQRPVMYRHFSVFAGYRASPSRCLVY